MKISLSIWCSKSGLINNVKSFSGFAIIFERTESVIYVDKSILLLALIC